MEVYSIYLFVVVVFGFLYEFSKNKRAARLMLTAASAIGLVFIACFRSPDVGKDVANYLAAFDYCSSSDWVELAYLRYEPGYLGLCKSISIFSTDEQFFIFVTAILILVGPICFVSINSKNPPFSFFLYVVMTFFAFSMSGIRQALATSVVLIGFQFLVSRRFFPFFSFLGIAGSFHLTSMAYVLAYFVSPLKITAKVFFVYCAAFLFLYSVKGAVLGFFVERYLDQYSEMLSPSDSYMYMVTMIFVLAFGLVYSKKVLISNPRATVLYNLIVLAIFFQLFGSESSNIIRVAELFYIAVIVFVPEVVASIKDLAARCLAYVLIVAVGVVQFYFIFPGGGYGVNPYSFYWG